MPGGNLFALWLYLELFAFLSRRGRRARALAEAPPRLSPAAARGCNCTGCDRERAAA